MNTNHQLDHTPYLVKQGVELCLDDYPTRGGEQFKKKSEARRALEQDTAALSEAQRRLWASEKCAVLIILQGIDASGKDGTIRHVMSGVNPQGCSVYSFKAPTAEELRHHFLWRPTRYLPGKGRIAIFNRSYYEEVLVVRVHPQFLEPQNLPQLAPGEDLWQSRFDDINAFEHSLAHNGTEVIKFYLHLSKKEQKKRFLERLTKPEKHWKFNAADLRERGFWDDYRRAYEAMLRHTSTAWAPWHIIPADRKWFARALVADIVTTRIGKRDLQYPQISDEQKQHLLDAKQELERE